MWCDGRVSVAPTKMDEALFLFFFPKVQPFCLGPPHFNGALPTQAHRIQHSLLTHTGESSHGSSLLNETWDEKNEKKQVHASKLTFRTRSVQPGSRCELSDGQSVLILGEVMITALIRSECRDQKLYLQAGRPIQHEPLTASDINTSSKNSH